jgi:hypothetical protein
MIVMYMAHVTDIQSHLLETTRVQQDEVEKLAMRDSVFAEFKDEEADDPERKKNSDKEEAEDLKKMKARKEEWAKDAERRRKRGELVESIRGLFPGGG